MEEKLAEVKIGDYYAYKTAKRSSWYDELGIVTDSQYAKLLEVLTTTDKPNLAQPEAVLPLLDAVSPIDLRVAYTQGFLDCERELSRRGIEDRRWDGDLSIIKRLFEAWAKKEGIVSGR